MVVVRLGESFRCSTYHKYGHRSFDISDHALTAPDHTRSNEPYELWDTPIPVPVGMAVGYAKPEAGAVNG